MHSKNIVHGDIKKIVSGKLPFNFEPPTAAGHTCAELLKSMLCLDPMKRISMKEILVHPFMKTKSHGPSKRTCDSESADSGPSKRLCKSKGSSQNIRSHEDKKSEEEIMVEPAKKNRIPGPKKRGRDSEGVDLRQRKRLCKSKGTDSL
uniref:Protein kinase domain-containing protein n=1 Tax=Eptatretus burgeri TaxID=7764 RepID=A0A8C4QLB6_EPTBU